MIVPPNSENRRIFLLCLLPLLIGIADHDVWTPDEPRETQMALEMVHGSSWVIPHLNGKPFVEKPPLYYWTIASLIMISGNLISPGIVARGASSLYSAILLLFVYRFVRKRFEKETAFDSIMILSTMSGFLELSHWIRIDSIFALLVSMAIIMFVDAFRSPNPWWIPAAYLSSALAFLTKGPIALAIISPSFLVMIFREPRRFLQSIQWHLFGAMLFLAPVLGWVYAFWKAAGSALFMEWFWTNQFGRFLGMTPNLGHLHGPFYYLQLIWPAFFPWCLVFIAWIVNKPARTALVKLFKTPEYLPVLGWALGGFIILSLSGTKRTIYLYPLLPAVAVIVAAVFKQIPRWLSRIYSAIAIVCFVSASMLIFLSPVIRDEAFAGVRFQLKPAAFVIVCLGIILAKALRERLAARVAVSMACFYSALMLTAVPALEELKNYRSDIMELVSAIPPEERSAVCGWALDQTTQALIPYYCDWQLPIVEDADRLILILKGSDSQYKVAIARLYDKFPPEGVELPPWKIMKRVKFLNGRELWLIRGEQESGRADHSLNVEQENF
jgi:4-amino-4-deoxy-L-arabinose transferase-like glycosyltransferase